jgi:predicted nucleic acid-binding protein
MIILDTNVVSEPTKAAPSFAVLAWLDEQVFDTLYLTTITIAEIGFRLACLTKGCRRDNLEAAFARTIELFAGRILPFDSRAATAYANLAAAAKAAGNSFPTPDGYIVAIAAANGCPVATRDSGSFLAGGISVINPWAYAGGVR